MFLYVPKDSKFVLIVVLLLVSAFAIDTILLYSYVISGIHIIMWVAVEVRLLCAKRRQTTELYLPKNDSPAPHSPAQ